MYVLIRDFCNDQLHLIHVNEMGYDTKTQCMWIDSHSDNSRDIPISEEKFNILTRKLFQNGRLDLSNTSRKDYGLYRCWIIYRKAFRE